MENTIKTNKKFRNPFPAIGKVFKYEMISAGRIILPLYAILLVMSLIIGLFIMDNNLEVHSIGLFGTAKTIMVILTFILYVVLFVVTISIIEKRYKKSMLGDEAYLNMTLPVTVGEHLWGRYLADMIWGIAYGIISLLSGAFILIKGWNQLPKVFSELGKVMAEFKMANGYSIISCILAMCFAGVAIYMLICIFSYMCNSVTNLVEKKRTLISILIFAVSFILYTNLAHLFFGNAFEGVDVFPLSFVMLFAFYNICWSAVFSIITRVILNKSLNLE